MHIYYDHHMTGLLEKDSKDIVLTPEFAIKSDLDIQTIKALSEYSKNLNGHLVLTGGYAVEALLGGKITRAHGDIDCVLLNLTDQPNEITFSQVQILLEMEQTKWKLVASRHDKVDWREDNETIPFNSRRRLELKIHKGDWPEAEYSSSDLINSSGIIVPVHSIGLYPTLAEKIHKLYLVKDGVDATKDRDSSLSDFIDLARLLQIKDINTTLLFNHISQTFESSVPVEEYDYVLRLLGSLNPQISRYLDE